jgi:hypothetical protein
VAFFAWKFTRSSGGLGDAGDVGPTRWAPKPQEIRARSRRYRSRETFLADDDEGKDLEVRSR